MENNAKGNILLIANTSSYLVSSIKDVLEQHNLNIVALDSKQEGIRNVTEQINAILIYADASLMERDDLIVYARDFAGERYIKVFMIGVPDELARLSQIVPVSMVEEKFTRPIDTSEVVRKIYDYVEKNILVEKKSILAVDDSGVYLREINSWFSEKYKVALVNSGLNALKYLGSHRPDLILLDYEMPVCNGKQVLEMIRSDTECGDIPVIFLTSNSSRDTIIDIMPLNVAGYLLKTLPSEQIKKYVDDFFESKNANKPNEQKDE